uniref:Zf-CCHC domain-containing protein/UBN2 domain-containing protein n=1 Tax=Tanacetum cinerariifolium TaxID=118510 RepID=A0A699GPQ8_TANCI|nr:zf-CCHC domain-containing protein/UBN2 domain-containing protein [Tanacetum cinerariifolium]
MESKVMTIEESKDLSSLALDKLIGNLKVHEVVIEKDSKFYKGKKERVKSIALKAKKESSNDETLTSESDDEEYAMAVRNFKSSLEERVNLLGNQEKKKSFRQRDEKKGKSDQKCFRCGDPNHLIGDCPKPSPTKIKRPSLEVHGAIAKMTPKTKPTMKLVSWLNRQMRQMEDRIFFNQSKYINEMLKKFGLEDSKPTKTPMSTDIKLTKGDDSMDSSKYRELEIKRYRTQLYEIHLLPNTSQKEELENELTSQEELAGLQVEFANMKGQMQQLKEELKKSQKAEKGTKNHDLLALLVNSNASSSQSHANSSYSPQPYYVTHPSSVFDYDDEYQGELQGDSQEDKLTNAMILLARAIAQKFSTPTNNRLGTSSNTRNQAVIQDGRVDIQAKNAGHGGNTNKIAWRQNRNQVFNAGNGNNDNNQIVQQVQRTESTIGKENVSVITAMRKDIMPVNASSKVHEQVSHVKRKTIIQITNDDQIDSNIIFDYPFVKNNGSTSEHDSNAHDEYHEIQMLAYNVQREAENQKRLNNELKKKKDLLQQELEMCKVLPGDKGLHWAAIQSSSLPSGRVLVAMCDLHFSSSFGIRSTSYPSGQFTPHVYDPKIEEDYHSVKDDVPLVSVYTTENVMVRGVLIPNAFLTDEIRATDILRSMRREEEEASVDEKSSPQKSLKVTIRQKQIVKKEKDNDDSENRLEPVSHKENPKIIDDDDKVKENVEEKNDDEMGSLKIRRQGYMIQNMERKCVTTNQFWKTHKKINQVLRQGVSQLVKKAIEDLIEKDDASPEGEKKVKRHKSSKSSKSARGSSSKHSAKDSKTYILVMRANDKPYSFSEADFKYLNKNAPTLTFPGIEEHAPYSIVDKPQTGLIYLNSKDEKRVMYLVEIVKFCDATLKKVLNEVKLRMFERQFLKKPPLLSDLDQDIMRAYEREISKRLSHREQMRRWEFFCEWKTNSADDKASVIITPYGKILGTIKVFIILVNWS